MTPLAVVGAAAENGTTTEQHEHASDHPAREGTSAMCAMQYEFTLPAEAARRERRRGRAGGVPRGGRHGRRAVDAVRDRRESGVPADRVVPGRLDR
ncbi:hypothetical protein [Streptomyces sp. NPDC086519]|uniref:hypothetical protein n=1 Tax=Streptomyces sp. NPDC086519 TaxID=3154863 RepID=UPI00341DD1B8